MLSGDQQLEARAMCFFSVWKSSWTFSGRGRRKSMFDSTIDIRKKEIRRGVQNLRIAVAAAAAAGASSPYFMDCIKTIR